MLQAYVAAGLDPAGFWSLTPREYLVRLRGADKRTDRSFDRLRAASAVGAWIGAHADAKGLEAYLASIGRKDAQPLTPEGVDRMLRHTAAGLPEIPIDDYLSMKRRLN